MANPYPKIHSPNTFGNAGNPLINPKYLFSFHISNSLAWILSIPHHPCIQNLCKRKSRRRRYRDRCWRSNRRHQHSYRCRCHWNNFSRLRPHECTWQHINFNCLRKSWNFQSINKKRNFTEFSTERSSSVYFAASS